MSAGRPIPSELLSGPDLGGGFLHQLSIDRLDQATTFTHHAQDGGQDAGGPAAGELGVLGFVHPPSACMFGGPRCWHRRFLLPFAATSRVRFAYQRHRLVLDPMLRQALGERPVPFEAAVEELVRTVAAPMRAAGLEWYVAGSASVRLLGGGGTPRDIDLGTERDGADRLGELLAPFLIEPVAPTDWPGDRLVLGARAFVGTPQAGARVEWSVPLAAGDPRRYEEFAAVAGVAATVPVRVGGEEVRVSRPEYALVRSAERGRDAGVEAAAGAVRRLGVDPALLGALLERSGLSEQQRTALAGRFRS